MSRKLWEFERNKPSDLDARDKGFHKTVCGRILGERVVSEIVEDLKAKTFIKIDGTVFFNNWTR